MEAVLPLQLWLSLKLGEKFSFLWHEIVFFVTDEVNKLNLKNTLFPSPASGSRGESCMTTCPSNIL